MNDSLHCSDTVVVFSERIERSWRNDIKSESFPVRVELVITASSMEELHGKDNLQLHIFFPDRWRRICREDHAMWDVGRSCLSLNKEKYFRADFPENLSITCTTQHPSRNWRLATSGFQILLADISGTTTLFFPHESSFP